MGGESHYALVQMALRASVRRSGGVCFHRRVRDAWFYSGEVVRLFAGYRLHNLISRKVTGAWWPPRSSKPLAVRFSDRGLRQMKVSVDYGQIMPNIPQMGRYFSSVGTALQIATNGEASPQAALQEAAANLRH